MQSATKSALRENGLKTNGRKADKGKETGWTVCKGDHEVLKLGTIERSEWIFSISLLHLIPAPFCEPFYPRTENVDKSIEFNLFDPNKPHIPYIAE